MNLLKRLWVYLSRLHHSLGFGIQSPTDYAFVRFVINEHSPYYAYSQLDDLSDEWLTRKLGKLYFRLANWRQPSIIRQDEYAPYWQAGCRKVSLKKDTDRIELARYVFFDKKRQKKNYKVNF